MIAQDIKHLIAEQVPFAAQLHLTVEDLSPSSARVVLPFDPLQANHAGFVHAGALFTAAETAALALGLGALQNTDVTCHSKAATIRLRKPARADLWAHARLDPAVEGGLPERITAEGKVDVPVLVEIVDQAGERAAEATVTLTLRRR